MPERALKLRVLLILALERACVVYDHVVPSRVRASLPGPLCPLAHLAFTLDERWQTGALLEVADA